MKELIETIKAGLTVSYKMDTSVYPERLTVTVSDTFSGVSTSVLCDSVPANSHDYQRQIVSLTVKAREKTLLAVLAKAKQTMNEARAKTGKF